MIEACFKKKISWDIQSSYENVCEKKEDKKYKKFMTWGYRLWYDNDWNIIWRGYEGSK